MDCFDELLKKTAAFGQEQLLRFWNELSAEQKKELSSEIDAIDFAALADLISKYVLTSNHNSIPGDLTPAPYFPLDPRNAEQKELYLRASERGEELLRAGRVSCLTVAGGQGSRLGFDGPKGTYPIGPVTGRTLFGYFAESIKRAGEKYGKKLSWYIMTSLLNREATETFFKENNFFGLASEQVFFFNQGTMPACGYDGKLLLATKSSLSLSPDGHGGTLLALRKSGALDRMAKEGVDFLSYFQVDNPLVPVVSPLFIGLHDLQKSEMSAIMLAKTGPFEKLGNFCVTGGRLEIIEYSDLPAELAESRNPDGTLRFIAGSPAIHLISRKFIENLTSGGNLRLPWHRADKKVPYIDDAGELVTPESPNAVKLESFIFDAMPLAKQTMVLEGDRKSVFAPTKNRTGVDSAESCREMLIERDAKYLEAAGVKIPRTSEGKVDAKIELSPSVAFDAEDVAMYVKAHKITEIARGAEICLE
ncbi:MAG: UTP--glucose-1-phosphate uridylyltransferase [Victivallales bacterium]|nr:UTP--glucose-1-phosphate uridylyltransferase [Victivallales bacterium]